MKLISTLIVLLLLQSLPARAEWQIKIKNDHYWLNSISENNQQFNVKLDNNIPSFIIKINSEKHPLFNTATAEITIDKNRFGSVRLIPSSTKGTGVSYMLEVKNKQQEFIDFMRHGVNLNIEIGQPKNLKQKFSISLRGFTYAWNELLIINELGELDPDKLINQERYQEALCIFAADYSTQITQLRQQGLSYQDTLSQIKQTGYKIIDEQIPDIVEQVYNLPLSKLPLGARGDKYGIFKRCMQGTKR